MAGLARIMAGAMGVIMTVIMAVGTSIAGPKLAASALKKRG